jgi:hypothetical protein
VIHYHGSPIGGTQDEAARFFARRHAFISFAHRNQEEVVKDVSQSFALDNGAFSVWKQGGELDIDGLYEWYGENFKHPNCDWAVIPDVIEGTEKQNDELLKGWPFWRWQGVPVWHYHESLGRLTRLCESWPRVALGSSGEWPNPGTPSWWGRTAEAMKAACDDEGRPLCKLHGLRMLNPAIFRHMPLASADSTNAVRNCRDGPAWNGRYKPPHQWLRATVIAERVEVNQSSARWVKAPKRERKPASSLFD